MGRLETIDWKRFDKFLGVVPDTHLAKVIGCTAFAVLARRRKLGVKPFMPKFGSSVPANLGPKTLERFSR